MSKRSKIEKVSKGEAKLRETSLPCGPQHRNIEAIAAAITVARHISGTILTRNNVLGVTGIIESLVNKLNKGTKMSCFFNRQNLSEED